MSAVQGHQDEAITITSVAAISQSADETILEDLERARSQSQGIVVDNKELSSTSGEYPQQEVYNDKNDSKAWYRRYLWRRREPSQVPEERPITGAYKAGFLSILLFRWMVPIISTGYKRPLQLNDVWSVSPIHRIDILAPRFAIALNRRRTASEAKKTWIHPLILALFDAFKRDFLISAACMLVTACLQVLTPFTLRWLIIYVQTVYNARNDSTVVPPGLGRGFGLVIAITCMQELQSLCQNHFYYRSMLLGGQVRSTLIAIITEKSLRLSGRARIDTDTNEGWSNGRINNLMSTDTSRLDSVCVAIHRCWSAPLQIILALALLCINLTYSALVGFGLICTILPLIGRFARSLAAVRKDINKLTDQRISLTQEAFSAIRVVKIFAWETKLEQRLNMIRTAETRKIAVMMAIRNAIICAGMMVTMLASMLTFITYYLSQHQFSAAPIFSSLALFNALGVPIEMLPMAIGQAIDAYASVKRIYSFLCAAEAVDETIWQNQCREAIIVQNADFSWTYNNPVEENDQYEEDTKDLELVVTTREITNINDETPANVVDDTAFKLSSINILVERSELIAVIGSVGAGKSSLLSALAGDMQRTAGKVIFGGSRAFCAQVPWIQNASIRENITFGKAFVQERYDQVISACALQHDLDLLSDGDLTEIGERGITLSGGQKQRLNIARAIYSDTDVVLLDDPLSAVDAHVGQHIMDEAICGSLLKDKCRILATHQLHFLRRADRIVWLREGSIYKIATFSELMEHDAGFQILMQTTAKADKTKLSVPDARPNEVEKIVVEKPKITTLMQKEEQATGSVKFEVYWRFLQATGTAWNIVLILLMMSIAQGVTITTSLWLSWWIAGQFDLPVSEYIGVYVALGLVSAVLMMAYGTTLTTLCTRAGRNLLRHAISRTIRAPVSFFDTTPLGRITNRFSKDIDTIDNRLTENLCFLFFIIANVSSVFGLAIGYYHLFAAALVPLLAICAVATAYYRRSAREIKRHEAVLRSSVFSRFGEAVTGTTTIRAYGIQKQFQASIIKALDDMDGAYFLTFAGQRWLSIRLDAVANTLMFVVGVLIVTTRLDVAPSAAGLVLAYMLTVGQYIQEAVHVIADVQNDMNAVERLHFYSSEIEQEGQGRIGKSAASNWPDAGVIAFNNVALCYRPGLPLVLQDLTFSVKPGERIGIVGRTGAGKSSILAALFRLVELQHGSICIDDEDISHLTIHDLRSRLAMIPQDPTLFKGTIRSNLDPFDEHQDLELWNALRQADLLNDEDSDRITLESIVEEEGHNYSLGQRQLLALARVLVRDSKIVVCDEATSSVDFETDLRVQKTMLRAFAGKTLLCIAHRLKTIIGYDRILVMDSGRVSEYDTPLALYDEAGVFRSMCNRSGITRQDLVLVNQA